MGAAADILDLFEPAREQRIIDQLDQGANRRGQRRQPGFTVTRPLPVGIDMSGGTVGVSRCYLRDGAGQAASRGEESERR